MGAPKLPNPIIDIKAPNHPQISQDDPMPAAAAAADARGDISTIVGMSLEKAQEKGSDQLQRQSPKVTGSVSTSPLLSSFDKFSFSGFYEVVLVVIFMKNKQMRITGTIPGRNQKRMSETRLRANSDWVASDESWQKKTLGRSSSSLVPRNTWYLVVYY